MKIVVQTLTGKTITFEVEPSHSVNHLKTKICKRDGIHPDCPKFLFAGVVLEVERVLFDYEI